MPMTRTEATREALSEDTCTDLPDLTEDDNPLLQQPQGDDLSQDVPVASLALTDSLQPTHP